MGERQPRKLSAAAIERCANIAGIQRRDIFDARLPKADNHGMRDGGKPYGSRP